MSKFKVGDRVRFVEDEYVGYAVGGEVQMGDVVTVTHVTGITILFDGIRPGHTAHISWFELVEEQPKLEWKEGVLADVPTGCVFRYTADHMTDELRINGAADGKLLVLDCDGRDRTGRFNTHQVKYLDVKVLRILERIIDEQHSS